MRSSYDTEALEEQVFGNSDGEDRIDSDLVEAEEAKPEETGTEEMGLEEVEIPGDGAPVMMNVTLEDGTRMEYIVAGVFLEGEKEYAALETEKATSTSWSLKKREAAE